MTAARPSQAVFDTPLLVAFRNGDPSVLDFVAGWASDNRPFVLIAVSALKMIARSPGPDERRVRLAFLENALVLPLTARESKAAHRLLAAVHLPIPLTADDAVVAATALIHKLPLYSTDPGRYAAVPGLTALPAR